MTVSKFYLASASPRRTEILRAMGIEHEVLSSAVDESRISADHPRTFAMRAAYAKAMDVAGKVPAGSWVLSADTVVTRELLLYGKPKDAADARRILRELSGQSHDVITAVGLTLTGRPNTFLRAERTTVVFQQLTDDQIEEYIATGEPLDKAGAYGIQGLGGALISEILGDYYNVVGLPCQTVADLMEEAGLEMEVQIPPPPPRWQ